jgi:hypothetical protein
LAWQSDCIEGSNLLLRNVSLTIDFKPRWGISSFCLTTVYGPTDEEAKQMFLTELNSLKPNPARPWVALGDFNQIYAASDKNNLNLNRGNMGRFRNALDQCDPFELSLQNCKYTWSNERRTLHWSCWTELSATWNGISCCSALAFKHSHLQFQITVPSLCVNSLGRGRRKCSTLKIFGSRCPNSERWSRRHGTRVCLLSRHLTSCTIS